MSLALADLLLGVAVMPFRSIRAVEGCWYFGEVFCLLHYSFDMFLTSVSIFHLICIAIDRYEAVCNPLRYTTNITVPTAWLMVFGCWGIAALYSYGLIYSKAHVLGRTNVSTMAYQYGKVQDPNVLTQTIISNIQKITQQTSEIQRIVNLLGTPQDINELRQQLQQKQQNVNHLAKETERCVKELGSLPVTTEQRQRKIQKDRLINDFSNALANFQKTQRKAAQKEKEFVARVRAESRASGGYPDSYEGNGNPFDSEGQAQVQSQEVAITDEDLQLIQERETSIRQLESDITGINEIFKDLAMMVHEQGDMIDSIEANVETADVHVQNASQQLAQAADYQRKSRKKICILIVVLVVLAVIIGLIIWASVKGS
ncbi:hypothetical protein DPEC_G00084050 [Dallia pectoralis]|uniref:Uncharacterized protein n=1 Tax=Dallia pectoralis TaxID=75939 RepID=A0ACC2GZ52_DALPE|nr:hypothetical protein DPEC_G00084050 [Dallia pectoralis]